MGYSQTPISHNVFARIGLLGNPSDGFSGRTISLSLSNFCAQVLLTPSEVADGKIAFLPNLAHDRFDFPNLGALSQTIKEHGYYGGIRLMMAMCNVFYQYCKAESIALKTKGFSLAYSTDIPRGLGLSGSSAIACATLNCLLDHFGLRDRVPVLSRPQLVLDAERELGITAGLQDRVIQVMGGLVYMDFGTSPGVFTPLDAAMLPRLWLIYAPGNASDSGKVHSTVKERFQQGDQEIIAGMHALANVALQGRTALEKRDPGLLGQLMNLNFDLRRSMFGDAALGALNLKMIETARSIGAAAKFTGSGGAIVALCPDGEQQELKLQAVCAKEGFSVELVGVAPSRVLAGPEGD